MNPTRLWSNKYQLARDLLFFSHSNEDISQIEGDTTGIPWTDTAWPFLFLAWKTESPGKAEKHFSTGLCRSLKKEAFPHLVVIKHWRIKWQKNCLIQIEIWYNLDIGSAMVSKEHLFLQIFCVVVSFSSLVLPEFSWMSTETQGI